MHAFFRKSLTLVLFFCLLNAFPVLAQGDHPVAAQIAELQSAGTSFETIQPFTLAYRPWLPQEKSIRDAQYLVLDEEALNHVWQMRPAAITVELPYNGTTLKIDLFEAPILTPGFSVVTSDGAPFTYTAGVYYRGVLRNDPNSIATLSFFENEIIGMVADAEHGNLVLGRLEIPDNLDRYVLYADKNLPGPMPFDCTVLEHDDHKTSGELPQAEVTGCVEVFLECDNELYVNKGSVLNTVNYVTGLYNQVITLYSNETISTVISQIYVWTTPDNYTNSSSSTALNEFQALRTNFSGDLAHLLSLGGNNVGGIAWLDVLCSTSHCYAYSNISSSYSNLPTYSWSVMVISHEMGHNLGSNHTHWCLWPGGPIDNCGPSQGYPNEDGPCANGPAPTNGGTVMSYCHLTSYGINLSNGFGPLPGQKIRDKVVAAQGSGCISSSCASYSCNPPTAITLSAITANSVTVTWTSVGGATSYNLQYRILGNAAWTTITGVTSPYVVTGLNDGTEYELQMQSVCGGSSSRYFVGEIFKTTYSACAVPSNLSTSSNTSTSSTITWSENGTSTSWEVQYGLRGFAFGTGTTVSAPSKPFTITGLSASLSYDFYVRADCGSGIFSNWAGPGIMNTALDNNIPTGAVLLTVGGPCPGENVYRNIGATLDNNEFNPNNAPGYWGADADNTVWFKFTAPSSGSVKITTDIPPQGALDLDDAQVALYSFGTVGNYNTDLFLSSNEDGGTVGSTYNPFLYYTGLTPGSMYYVQVDGWSQTGYFCIEVHETMELPNPGTGCATYTESSVNGSTNPTKWYNIYSKPDQYHIGYPLAAVKSSSNLGTVTLSATKAASVPVSTAGIPYMQRYFNFSSSSGSSGNKSVRLLYTTDELSNLQAASGNSGTADDLNISHYDGNNEDCQQNNNTNGTYTVINSVAATTIGSSGVFFEDFTSPGFSEMGAHFGTGALPLELIRFSGAVLPAANRLQWETGLEANLALFLLERSPNGADNWTEISRVLPVNTNQNTSYQYTDEHPLPKSFYRLKIAENDGSQSYSGVVLLERDDLAAGLLNLYPNPAGDALSLEYLVNNESGITVSIHFADGKLAFQQKFDLEKGTNRLSLNLSALPAGTFFLKIESEKGVETRFFVKR